MFRYAVSLLLLGVCSAALATFYPGWTTTAGLDVWNLPKLERELADNQRLSENLDWQEEIVRDRTVAKSHILQELLARRLTLTEAAARFRGLDHEPAECPERGPDYYAGRTEGERYCREVIQWVRAETMTWPPTRGEETLSRLEAELNAYLSTHGGEVILPTN